MSFPKMYKSLNFEYFSWINWSPRSGEYDAVLVVITYTNAHAYHAI